MKSPYFLRLGALTAALAGLMALPGVGMAEDLTPPVVAKPLSNLTITAGTTGSVINLKKTFKLSGVTGTIVRLATAFGGMDMTTDLELYDSVAPLNVANFLSYVNSGEYNKTFIARVAPGFVLQAGGYYVDSSNQIDHVAQNAAVAGEHTLSNTRGTVALALSTGPDSGTSEWFINLADNTGLDDTSDGGPFTVFARVIEGGMDNVDAIAALPVYDFSTAFNNNPAFASLPLYDYDSTTGLSLSNLVDLNDAVVIPLIPDTPGADAALTLKAKSNNTALVTATITGKKLKLAYVPGKTGTAKIKVLAKDSAGTQTKSQFTVTVQ